MISPTSKAQQELVARFLRLTEPCQRPLLRIATALCQDSDQAADLTQEALVRAFRAFDRFDLNQPLMPWLCRILRNVHLDSFKTGRSKHELAEHQLPARQEGGVLEGLPSGSADPLALLERAELGRQLQAALERLDDDQRLVVILCDVEGLSYEEASAVADVPVGTIRSRLSRARERLRRQLRRAAPSSLAPDRAMDGQRELSGAHGRIVSKDGSGSKGVR